MPFETSGIYLESIILSEVSQMGKNKNCIISFFKKHQMTKQNIQANTLIGIGNKMVVAKGEGNWGRSQRLKGVKYMVMGGDWTPGGEHRFEYTNALL